MTLLQRYNIWRTKRQIQRLIKQARKRDKHQKHNPVGKLWSI